MKKNVLLVLASLVVGFVVCVGLDRFVGLFQPAARGEAHALIFPPNLAHNFRTREFSYKVRANSLGFRDREFDLKKTAKTRILAIGDSFTFGYGVEGNQAWPKVLEARLRAAGYDVEIANLGRPGASPRGYAAVAEKAIPVLKPDLVIVGVLQGDDLGQMADPPGGDSTAEGGWAEATEYPRLRRAMNALFPHALALVDTIQEPDMFLQWKQHAQSVVTGMTPEMKARFETIGPRVREALLDGQLNPALIVLSTRRPDYFLSTMEVTSPYTQHLIEQMAAQFTRIEKAARQNNARAVVASIPYGVYVSEASLKTRHELGFEVVPEMLTTGAADEAIRRASEMAGFQFYRVTDEFRRASPGRDLYFELDGHFNAAGHALFASSLMPAIEKVVSRKGGEEGFGR